MPNTITGAWLKTQFDVQFGENRICLDTILQYGGVYEDFETETLNPFFKWTNNGLHKWEYCPEDAYQGQFCFQANADTVVASLLKAQLKAPHVKHHCKISFYYKTDENDTLFYYNTGSNIGAFSSKDWQYAEMDYNGKDHNFVWSYKQRQPNNLQTKIDNICFPPLHTTIASAGDKMIACVDAPVELKNAYAYDCNAVFWTTEGDGRFEYDSIPNPTYFPGSQDLANGRVTLTMSAFGNDTLVSSTQIQFMDEINLGDIAGDSVVNKYEQSISHYSIEYQEGVYYLWQLEPASAGSIYTFGNAIDILWDLYEGDTEATLSVKTDNGCNVEPVIKRISLIGTGIAEWHAPDFELFPNPTNSRVNLVLGENLQGNALIEVFNLLGERLIYQKVSQLHQGETLSLDLSNVVSGLYIIKLSTKNGSCTKKVSVW